MKNLQVIEINGQRVLTSKQLAEAYGTTRKIISYNFQYNRRRYMKGKHYIELSGDELRNFKNSLEIQDSLKYAHILQLWTEKGALLHAKSINTDKAWQVYDYLVDFYFRVKEYRQPIQEKKPSGKPVVDVPENIKIQDAIKVAKDYLTALDVSLTEYNAYRSEESHKHYCVIINNMAVTLMSNILNLLEIKPNIVEKIL